MDGDWNRLGSVKNVMTENSTRKPLVVLCFIPLLNAATVVLIIILAIRIASTISWKIYNCSKQDADTAGRISSLPKDLSKRQKRPKEGEFAGRDEVFDVIDTLGEEKTVVNAEDQEGFLNSISEMKKRLEAFGPPQIISIKLEKGKDDLVEWKKIKKELKKREGGKPVVIDMESQKKNSPPQKCSSEKLSGRDIMPESSRFLITPTLRGAMNNTGVVMNAATAPDVFKGPTARNNVIKEKGDFFDALPPSSHSGMVSELSFPQTFAYGQKRVDKALTSLSDQENSDGEGNMSILRKNGSKSNASLLRKRFSSDSDSWKDVSTSPEVSDMNFEPKFPQTSAYGQKRFGKIFISISDEALFNHLDRRTTGINTRPLSQSNSKDGVEGSRQA